MIGIDIGVRRCHVCDRRTGDQFSAPSDRVCHYLSTTEPTTVVLEMTGYYGLPIAEAALRAGHHVLIAHDTDAASLRTLLRRQHKNDRLDAQLLADLAELALREPLLTQRHLTPYEELRPLITIRRYAHAWRTLTELRSRIRQRNRHPHTEPLPELEQHLTSLIEDYQTRTINAVPHQQMELLRSIPGITPPLAALLYATIGDVNRFRNTNAVVSYCGVAPKHRPSSGETARKPRRHRYAVLLTTHLHMYALRVAAHPDDYGRIGKTYVRVKARTDGRRALHAVKRHLIRIVAGVLRSQKPYDDDYPSSRAADQQASA